jgi:hypothetical protein
MTQKATFDEVLDVVDNWSSDQQADLLEVVQRRLAERRRKQIVQDVKDARSELNAGTATVSTVDDIMREIES